MRDKIFLCDLTHTGINIAAENIPLNIGFLSSYANTKFEKQYEIFLFKYPEKLQEALKKEIPSIIGFSNYVWNDSLNEYFCKYVKSINEYTLTLKGGPNFPLGDENRILYLREHCYTDFYIPFEGEEAFVNFLTNALSKKKEKIKDESIDGCVFLNNKGDLISGKILPKIQDVNNIPSPYLDGTLDSFFDGNLIPMLETTRGCPFTCNFCNYSTDYYTKVARFSFERVKEELHYMAQYTSKKSISALIISDNNFGMFDRDRDIALEIKKCQENYGWPLSIYVETSKTRLEKVLEVVGILKESVRVKMSCQSTNNDVLEEIGRKNLSRKQYIEMAQNLRRNGLSVETELVQPLPLETFESYMESIDFLISCKVDKIISYTLQVNNGTLYREKEYQEKYCYKTSYRAYANCAGIYGDRIIVEKEMVGIATNTFSFDEYIKCRKIAFLLQLLYNNTIFAAVSKLLDENNIKRLDFINMFLQNGNHVHIKLQKAIENFVAETKEELFKTKEGFDSFFSHEENYRRLRKGLIGRNVLFSNYAIVIGTLLEEVVESLVSTINVCCQNSSVDIPQLQIEDIRRFSLMKLNGIFTLDTEASLYDNFHYDILGWLLEKDKKLQDFKVKETIELEFYFSKEQRELRKDHFARYGEDVLGIVKIIARVSKVVNLFRQVRPLRRWHKSLTYT